MRALAERIGLYRVAALMIACALVLEILRVRGVCLGVGPVGRVHLRRGCAFLALRHDLHEGFGRRRRLERIEGENEAMGKGYAGPAAEEAERRLEELAEEPKRGSRVGRAAVYGSTLGRA